VTSRPEVAPALRELLIRLDVAPCGGDRFRDAGSDSAVAHVFGGQLAAQALMAMGRTVGADRPPHSLHVHFLSMARSQEPLDLQVERLKEGRAFDLRQVTVRQGSLPVLTAVGSFHVQEPGPLHPPPSPDRLPVDPGSLPRWEEQFAGRLDRLTLLWQRPRAFDLRHVDPPPQLEPDLSCGQRTSHRVLWRADGDLPDDPLLHACLAVHATDATVLETALLPLGQVFADGNFHAVSLDHTLWFHLPFRTDRWLLHEQSAEALAGGRGFATSRTYDRDGRLVLSTAQEGLLRPASAGGAEVGRRPPRPADEAAGEARVRR
jgi:acyl-CoA thioesterase-2